MLEHIPARTFNKRNRPTPFLVDLFNDKSTYLCQEKTTEIRSCVKSRYILSCLQADLPGGLVVRIRRSHRRGRGSIPRLGKIILVVIIQPSFTIQVDWPVFLY